MSSIANTNALKKSAVESPLGYLRDAIALWNRFWFEPQQADTLAVIRILGGAMLFYTHAVWSLRLTDFLGPHGLISHDASVLLNQGPDGVLVGSYLWSISSPSLLWTQHILALVVFALLTVGFRTRIMAVLSLIITLSYSHRLIGAQFGLDQINAMLAMYLIVGPSGAKYSIDRWLADRAGKATPAASSWTTIAIRLIQLHMCVIYLFGGIGKMRGEMWWDGSAVWYAIANLEYQSLDVTGLVRWPWLIALLTHTTVFWEIFYCFFIWPKLTRPLWLALAVGIHGGIGLILGMKTFALVMIIGNLAFVYPETMAACIAAIARRTPGLGRVSPA